MNEGIHVFRRLTPQEREARLLRCGLHPALTPGSRAKLEAEQPVTLTPGAAASVHTVRLKAKNKIHRQQYRITIFNLEVLEIQALGTGQAMGGSIAAWRGDGEASRGGEAGDDGQRVENSNGLREDGYGGDDRAANRRGTAGQLREVAVRALYSMGLDSGEVYLTAMGDRNYAIAGITPMLPAHGRPLPDPYRAASAALAAALEQEPACRPGLLMGMDPEFILLRETSGRVVPASRFLPLDGVAGCDAGPPGTHGKFPVAELRPAPRGEPRALLAQLMSAARTADRLVTDRSLRWRAGGMPLPGWALGGHLHFSGVTLTAPLLRALDNYLALPLMLLEDASASARRPRYGVLGDFRIQPHGGFEYRTLPSFLVSPVIAKGAVYLAHLIVSRYEDLPLRPLDREDLHAAYYSGDKPPLRAAFLPLQAQLRDLQGYTQVSRYIEPLLGYIAAERTWNESRDIRGLWQKQEVLAEHK